MKKALFILILLILAGCASNTEVVQPTAKAVQEPSVVEEPVVVEQPPAVEDTVEQPAEQPVGVVQEPELSLEEQQAKAVSIAEKYVKGLEGYNKYNGSDIEIKPPVKSGCDGCFIIDGTFNRDNPSIEGALSRIKFHLRMEAWKIEEYSFK